eukprot:3980741-Pyramimonas_sp.AAC.1
MMLLLGVPLLPSLENLGATGAAADTVQLRPCLEQSLLDGLPHGVAGADAQQLLALRDGA